MNNTNDKKYTILIADNDRTWLNDAKEWLENDYTIILATKVVEAHKILLEKKCDLAIIDNRLIDDDQLSDISGFLLTSDAPDIPKLLVSRWKQPEYLALKNTSLEKDGYPLIQFFSKSQKLSKLREIVKKTFASMLARRSRSVFVVHGRNLKIRNAMFEFLSCIGLHPIHWTDATVAAGASPFISEILDQAFEGAKAIIVILTPDDEAKLKKPFIQPDDPSYEKRLYGQVRPNVLFEAGLAFGRKPNNTLLVQIGDVRPFSDIAGKYIIRLDNTMPKRKQLAKHLENAGCTVNLNNTEWLTAGDFSV
jgi:predicted nucleotide-binding protein